MREKLPLKPADASTHHRRGKHVRQNMRHTKLAIARKLREAARMDER